MTPSRRRFAIAFLLLALATPGVAQRAAAPAAPPPDLDGYVDRVMRTFHVPGLALAVVKDGRVVVANGYGVRKLGEPDSVDAHTLFGIASNTKAFTATALALLVEDGKLEWDAPVIRYLPWFQMYDPWVTREITVRDLLVHRSGLGLGAGDLLWWPPSDYDRKEIARRLRFIPPATSFRSAYAYDNVLYCVAGEVIEAVSGEPWEDFVASRILAKIGMTDSNVRNGLGATGTDAAWPHAFIDGELRPITPFRSDVVNPAGGINSSVTDMAKWLIVQLDSGRVENNERLFTPRTTRQLWGIVTPIPMGDPPPELRPVRAQFNGYALGFDITSFRGYKLVTHTGGLPGFVSRVAMIPQAKLGLVVLTNAESGAAFNAIAYHLLDHYLDAPAFDWLAAYRAVTARRDSAVAASLRSTATARDSTSGPSLPLEKYAGTYRDAWYGDVTITMEANGPVIRFTHTPSLVGDLTHWQHDTFIARWRDRELRADAFVTFALNPDGSIDQVKLAPVSPATDFSFDFRDLMLRPVGGEK